MLVVIFSFLFGILHKLHDSQSSLNAWPALAHPEENSDVSYNSSSIVSDYLTATHQHSKWVKFIFIFIVYILINNSCLIKMKYIFALVAIMACLISTSHCSSSDRSLAGCLTGLNRCSEAISWFSNIFMESCNDYCVRAGILKNIFLFFSVKLIFVTQHDHCQSGSIGGACVLQPTNCQLRSEGATVRQCKCY